tara:strand:+ start:17795 stop:18133 length:339 start_codon:yes stop_codon:yes gene_type:complete
MGLILPSHVQKARNLQKHCEGWARDIISKAYPNHEFGISFLIDDKSYRIDHRLMEHSKACMYVHPGEDDKEKALIRVAGEILERVGLPRAALEDYDQYDDVLAIAKGAFACR